MTSRKRSGRLFFRIYKKRALSGELCGCF
ncbi:hypothetical protein Gotur_031274 [Gossypium turneri]